MSRSLYASIAAASLILAGLLPAKATNVPITNFQGTWSGTATYQPGAVVTYLNATYVALLASHDTRPLGHTTKWQLLSVPVGGAAFSTAPVNGLSLYPGNVILSIPIAVAGEYFFSASALVSVDAADYSVDCYVTHTNGSFDGVLGGINNPFPGSDHYTIIGSAAVSDFWYLSAGDDAQLYCYSDDSDELSEVLNAGLTVTLVTDPAKVAETQSNSDKPSAPPPQPHSSKQR